MRGIDAAPARRYRRGWRPDRSCDRALPYPVAMELTGASSYTAPERGELP